MRNNAKWLAGFIATVAALSIAGSAAAQSGDQASVILQQAGQDDSTLKVKSAGGRGRGGATDGTAVGAVGFGDFEAVYTGPPITGRPYSAQITTESIQVLPDGNKISHKNIAMVYRDSMGRTRREQTLNAIGPYSSPETLFQITSIDDPVAKTHYVLNQRKKVASQVYLKVSQLGSINTLPLTPKIASPENLMTNQSVLEDLGAQTIEGVVATGTRITRTIPAGEIGNEQPIQIVTEKWYSEELQITIITRHSDPRTGTTTTTLTKLSRNEPDASLFTIPSDYTVKPLTGPVN